MLDGRPRPDHGTAFVERVCDICSAGWVGLTDDLCWWCERRADTNRDRIRQDLLKPSWLRSSVGDPRYDALDDDTKAVWDRTRGQARGADSIAAWVARLAEAITTGTITPHEADTAIRKVIRP